MENESNNLLDMMVERRDIEIAQDFACFMRNVERYVGKPYLWGGDDPMKGFDCSGLVVECLKAAGIFLENEDYTADGLWHLFYTKQIEHPRRGALIFRFDADGKRAVHVGVCTSERHYVAAEGGGSFVKTLEDAIKHNAFIKERPIKKIPNPKFVDPWM
jgi:cell wall-associated NlpC family hydrolase